MVYPSVEHSSPFIVCNMLRPFIRRDAPYGTLYKMWYSMWNWNKETRHGIWHPVWDKVPYGGTLYETRSVEPCMRHSTLCGTLSDTQNPHRYMEPCIGPGAQCGFREMADAILSMSNVTLKCHWA